jgi:two-component system, NarL family, sensor histidine kinase UhpB
MARLVLFLALVAVILAAPLTAMAAPQSVSDTGPLLGGTKAVAIGLAVATALLSVLLYVIPMRAATAARRSVETTMSERVLTLQEEDRRSIARELHDGAGQALTAARLQLIALRESQAAPREPIQQIIASVDAAIDEIRRSTSALAPPALAEFGLVGALKRHCDGFASASGLDVRLNAPALLPQLPAHVETTVYRIVQEGLTNVARHAGATVAWVDVSASPSGIRLEMGDDGSGMDASRKGFGLDSIGERARLAGGNLELIAEKGPGTRLRVTIPLGPHP